MITEYRAWDKISNKMDYDPYGDEYLCEGTPINDIFKNPYNGQIFLQYTNKQDSSGKKIFQGDFVWQKRKDNCFGGKNDEEICLIGEPEYLDLSDRESGGADGNYPIIEMRVIGNKFENPELINRVGVVNMEFNHGAGKCLHNEFNLVEALKGAHNA